MNIEIKKIIIENAKNTFQMLFNIVSDNSHKIKSEW